MGAGTDHCILVHHDWKNVRYIKPGLASVAVDRIANDAPNTVNPGAAVVNYIANDTSCSVNPSAAIAYHIAADPVTVTAQPPLCHSNCN